MDLLLIPHDYTTTVMKLVFSVTRDTNFLDQILLDAIRNNNLTMHQHVMVSFLIDDKLIKYQFMTQNFFKLKCKSRNIVK